jgi:diacylglycerol O-acyltransferase
VREPLLGLGLPRWEFDPHFDMDYHVPIAQLPAPGGQVELQQLVGDLMSQPFDRRHPLWQFYFIENYQGGCAIVPRLHHCIADGLALVQVLLSMTDTQPVAPPKRPESADRAAANRSGFHPLRPVRQLIDTASGAARLVTREAMLNFSDPARVTQAVGLGALTFNAASKLLLTSPDQKTIINGKSEIGRAHV